MNQEELACAISQYIINECVLRIKESSHSVVKGQVDPYILSPSENEKIQRIEIEPIAKELCALNIYYLLRLLEGNFGMIHINNEPYQFRLTIESLDNDQKFTVIPPDDCDEIGPYFLEDLQNMYDQL